MGEIGGEPPARHRSAGPRSAGPRLLVGGQTSLMIGRGRERVCGRHRRGWRHAVSCSGRFWDNLITAIADVQLTFPNILLALSVMIVLGPAVQHLILVLVLPGGSSWLGSLLADVPSRFAIGTRGRLAGRSARPTATCTAAAPASCRTSRGPVLVLLPVTFGPGHSRRGVALVPRARIMPPASQLGRHARRGAVNTSPPPGGATFACSLLMLTIVAINLIGDSLRDILDPRIQ